MKNKLSFFGKNFTKMVGKIGRKFSKALSTKSKIAVSESAQKKNFPKKKILMFGWELPPFNSGGLGVACFEMAKSISSKNTDVTFVLPKKQKYNHQFMKVTFPDDDVAEKRARDEIAQNNIEVKEIDTPITPYLTEKEYEELVRLGKISQKTGKYSNYSQDLVGEVMRYGEEAGSIARRENFDIIHVHDWLSYPAGIKAKKVSKKPLVAHVHALEYDRCHEAGVNRRIVEIEKAGLEAADKVITVSKLTKERVMKYYGISSEKIEVVHNGIALGESLSGQENLESLKKGGKKLVLFTGRITYQKGVDYLVTAAKKALQIDPKIVFMIVGSGDMLNQIIAQTASLGISDHFYFPGFLRGKELASVYAAADLYVMPSVSEPFGLVALEALAAKVPVILSKQSGAGEVLNHALKVDFWDTDELANKIASVLHYNSLRHSMIKNGFKEVEQCNWNVAADKCLQIYNSFASA